MSILEITLSDEEKQFLEEETRAGAFASESEVVQQALAEFRTQRMLARLSPDETEKLRQKIQVGLEQFERGEVVEWNPEEMKARVRQRLQAAGKA